MPSPTAHNILKFGSETEYQNTLAYLEQQYEDHDNGFLATWGHLSDDDLDDMEESLGFNDQLPMEEFEATYEFYSLRAELHTAEEAWLDQSDQPGWSWNNDPTANAFIDGIEQTLWNPYNEVIICDFLYKYIEDGLIHLPINHEQFSDILTVANNGASAQDLVDQFGGQASSSMTERDYAELFVQTREQNSCITDVNEEGRIGHPINHSISMVVKHKIRSGPFNKVFKAVTKSYKHKRSKWRKRRTRILAGVVGKIGQPELGCGTEIDIDKQSNYGKKRRRERAVRIRNGSIIPSVSAYGALPHQLKTIHIQEASPYDYLFQ
jgi:hypothetical protein